MDHLATLGGIAGLFLLACLSPGPVWLVITSTAITESRRAGLLAGLGVAAATLCWAALAMLGLALLGRLTWLETVLRLAGAAYLVWLGCRMVARARRPAPAEARPTPGRGGRAALRRNGLAALRRGFLASITNPKAAAFFGSIFVVALPASAPGGLRLAAVLLLAALSAGWHCGLAVVFSTAPVQAAYRRARRRIETVVGVLLVALGVRLALAR